MTSLKRVKRLYTGVRGSSGRRYAYLQVDNQRFNVCDYQPTIEDAEWYRHMLAIALTNLINKESDASTKTRAS